MATAQIKYVPVGNGDQSLITLADKTTLMVDCNLRKGAKGDDDETMFDAHTDLLNSIQRDPNGVPYVDVFILTHGDQDHCRGFKEYFYQGDPKNYSESDKKKKLIRVDAMWFSPMIAEEHENEDEEAYQKEAERRLELHRSGAVSKDLPGNRIRIIGYDGNKDYKALDHLRSIPGQVVSRFNDKDQDTFSVFIHSPFKEHLKSATPDKKNSTSIVFQARFKERKTDTSFSCLAMFGGDSDHYAWDLIMSRTKKSGKDKTESALLWDLFLAPHHCSWSFFNDRPQKDHPTPQKNSVAVLDGKRGNAPKVIASSRKIKVEEPNPPHDAAKKEYVKKVGESNFLNTTTYHVIGQTPQPIIFEISSSGPVKPKQKEGTAKVAGASTLGAVNLPSTYGSKKA